MQVKTVAIVGAGPSGLVTAKYLLAEGCFTRVDIFEQRSRVGGVWNYDPAAKRVPPGFPVPQTSPALDVNGCRGADEDLLSPLYDKLETNIMKDIMGFSDLDWPEDAQLFPKHETVTAYIEKYAEDVKHLIKWNTTVTKVEPVSDDPALEIGWKVRTRDQHGTETETEYDAVVVANGHFNVPHIPDFPGLKEWAAAYPGSVSHSMFFKHPDDYQGKKVLVIGNSASGIDIASQICETCAPPLLLSARSESMLLPLPTPKRKDLPGIAAFLPQDRAVLLADSTVERDIDAAIFCTGYFYSFPFLSLPSLRSSSPAGSHVRGLHAHLLLRARPSLAFPVLLQRAIPFPVAEVQAAVLCGLWSGRLPLPPAERMEAYERAQIALAGDRPKDTHLLRYPRDAEYINFMHDWAAEGGGGKKTPPRWGRRMFWLRSKFPEVRKAFQAVGGPEEKAKVKTVEELGFDFEEWEKENPDALKNVV